MMADSRIAEHGGVWPMGCEWGWLAVIVGVHGALLTGAMFGLGQTVMPVPSPVAPPTVTGVLVAAWPPAAVLPPQAMAAAPERAKPHVAPRPREATPSPPSNASAAERAPAALPAEPGLSTQAESTSPATQGTPSAAAAPAVATEHAPAVVIPPRTDAAHLNNPAPHYPTVSRRFGEEGRALFDVYILPDGRVGEIRLRRSSGHARLDEAALDAVRRWRYVPARRGSEPIPYWYVQPVVFSLNS